MASAAQDPPLGGSLAAAISNAVVRITAECTGRGPTKARTSIRDDLIVVLMQETLTKGERSLHNAGDCELVLQTRAGYQNAMRRDLIVAIETLSERTVIAFMSANHIDPDMGAAMFVLQPTPVAPGDVLPTTAKSDRGAHESFEGGDANAVAAG